MKYIKKLRFSALQKWYAGSPLFPSFEIYANHSNADLYYS